jgi:hypothetical protein
MTMVSGFIASKQRELDAHPLLDQLRRDEPGIAEGLAPRLPFPVAELEDVVRHAQQLVRDAVLALAPREAIAMANRCYEAFWETLDELECSLAESRATAPATASAQPRWRWHLAMSLSR